MTSTCTSTAPITARSSGGARSPSFIEDGDDEPFFGEDVVAPARALHEVRASGTAEARRAALLRLPFELRESLEGLLLRLDLALASRPGDVRVALWALERRFPGTAAVAFKLLAHAVERADVTGALEAVEALGAAVGPDGYLHGLRAHSYADLGKSEEAEKAYEEAIRVEPDLEDPYWGLVMLSLEAADFEAVARRLTRVEEAFDFEIGPEELKGIPEYAAFVESEAFRAWAEARK